MLDEQARGALTARDTGGIEVRYGDAETVHRLLEMMAYREGFGDLLAEGSVTLASGASTAREWTIWLPNRKDDMPFYVLNSQSISARQSGEGSVQ